MKRKIWIIGHRGASGSAPENTLSAFTKAVEMGADMIELDVQLTRDNQLIVMHDPTVNRTTDGSGRISNLTLAELQRLDAGAWFGSEFKGEKIPTLLQVIQKMAGRCYLNIEVKRNRAKNKSSQRPIEEVLLETLSMSPLKDSLLISSFDYKLLTRLKSLNPRLKLAFLFSRVPWNIKKRMAGGTLYAIHPQRRITSVKLVTEAHRLGLQVNVWTVDEPEQMQKLINLGVDGIISNFPERGAALSNRIAIRVGHRDTEARNIKE